MWGGAPAHAFCTATLRFAPTATGDHGGALTISDGTPAGRYPAYLRGHLGSLADGAAVTASSENGCCPANAEIDGNTGT